MTEISRLIYETIDEINEQSPPDRKISKSEQTVIVGEGSALDSLGIINFLVSLEERVAAFTGRSVTLLNDEVLSDPARPLRTLALIEKFISEQIPN